ncbi:hypothetical protein OBBRIDRAFT_795178 [Obba rivulosa]|uniref:Uncharacterized protein n=1 Tax=Obba rivulosa TaxID=1052685 RepID=A0A8E2APZ0_9APHY|nr:hypothetical protein OBBRIDRAFT_795178 [Obba rivulosa]
MATLSILDPVLEGRCNPQTPCGAPSPSDSLASATDISIDGVPDDSEDTSGSGSSYSYCVIA